MNNFEMEELIPVVAELTEKYTSKQSTSVSYDTAKQLMNAVMYCINEIEFDCVESDAYPVRDIIQEKNAKLAYRKGYELVVKKVLRTKALYDEIIQEFNAYRNRAYYDTIIEGMPAFFLYYDPKFNPQNHILTLDYPTIKYEQDLCGIDAIYKYLWYTKYEQMFLNAFPEEYVTTLLSRYNADYEELFINIGSIVLRNIIVCMIAGKNIIDHTFEENDFNIIKKLVKSCTKDELEIKIDHLISVLVNQGYQRNEQLYEYLKEDVKNISFELINAVENDCLNAMFLL